MTPPLLTVSEARDYRACPRLHHIRYGLGYRPIDVADTLRFGALFDRGLQAWWGTRSLDAAIEAVQFEADPFDRVRAEALLAGYDTRWHDEPLEVLAVQPEFSTELRNPTTGAASRTYRLGGKLDAIVRHVPSGRVLIVEGKTSSEDISVGSEYWRRLRLDAQVSTYMVGARALGHDPTGCLYDVVGKPALRPLKATPPEARKYTKDGRLYAAQREIDETPDEYGARVRAAIAEQPERYYARGEVTRLDDEERDAAHDMWSTARSIRESELAARHPRNPDACVRYGRTCAFFDVCTGASGLDDPLRFRHTERPHEELAAPDKITQQEMT